MAASVSENEKRNRRAWEKMDTCQRECGKSAQELVSIQQTLRADFYRRSLAC